MDDCEPPQCYHRSLPKARKQHRCCECRGWIERGEIYERFEGIWDGEGLTFKTCPDCFDIRRRLAIILRNECGGCDVAFTRISEELQEGDHDELSGEFLSVMVRRGAPIHRSWWDTLRSACR